MPKKRKPAAVTYSLEIQTPGVGRKLPGTQEINLLYLDSLGGVADGLLWIAPWKRGVLSVTNGRGTSRYDVVRTDDGHLPSGTWLTQICFRRVAND